VSIADPVAPITNVSREAGSWYDRISQEKARSAAARLKDAALVVSAMVLYDHDCRQVYRGVKLTAQSWTKEAGDDAMKAVRHFEHDRALYQQVQISLASLRTDVNDIPRRRRNELVATNTIIACGQQFLDTVALPIRNEKGGMADSRRGTAFNRAMLSEGNFSRAAAIKYADKMLNKAAPLQNLLDDALPALGTVQALIIGRHHLPPPDWIVKHKD
jgi:hypothetical protein